MLIEAIITLIEFNNHRIRISRLILGVANHTVATTRFTYIGNVVQLDRVLQAEAGQRPGQLVRLQHVLPGAVKVERNRNPLGVQHPRRVHVLRVAPQAVQEVRVQVLEHVLNATVYHNEVLRFELRVRVAATRLQVFDDLGVAGDLTARVGHQVRQHAVRRAERVPVEVDRHLGLAELEVGL